MKNYFKSISNQMCEQLKSISSEFSHPSMKGNSNEFIIKTFLKKYLPKKYSIAQGKIVDFRGKESKQVDIIIFDNLNSVPFYIDEVNIIVPIEFVYGTIEVKANLSKTSFKHVLDNQAIIYDLLMSHNYKFNGDELFVSKSKHSDYPKIFVIGLNKSRSSPIRDLCMLYVKFCKDRNIRFPFIDCCAILDDGYFIDSEQENEGSEAYLNEETKEDTLIYFFINVVQKIGTMTLKTLPDYVNYLNFYKQIDIKPVYYDT